MHLFQNGYVQIARDGFDRKRAIFPETVLAFIRETQPKEWAKLEGLHGDKTGEQRNDALPLRRTPISAIALLFTRGNRASRRVRVGGWTARDSASLNR